MTYHLVDSIEEVLRVALDEDATPALPAIAGTPVT